MLQSKSACSNSGIYLRLLFYDVYVANNSWDSLRCHYRRYPKGSKIVLSTCPVQKRYYCTYSLCFCIFVIESISRSLTWGSHILATTNGSCANLLDVWHDFLNVEKTKGVVLNSQVSSWSKDVQEDKKDWDLYPSLCYMLAVIATLLPWGS